MIAAPSKPPTSEQNKEAQIFRTHSHILSFSNQQLQLCIDHQKKEVVSSNPVRTHCTPSSPLAHSFYCVTHITHIPRMSINLSVPSIHNVYSSKAPTFNLLNKELCRQRYFAMSDQDKDRDQDEYFISGTRLVDSLPFLLIDTHRKLSGRRSNALLHQQNR